jgi:colanic acid/amylovoran biosynthesis protein
MRILLSAYFDHNLGDDLFVDYFVQRYREHDVELLCDDEMQLNPQIELRGRLRKIGLRRAVKSLHRFDALVIIGGSIFQEIPNFYKYDYRRNALVTLVRLLGNKVFILGSNIGPVHTSHGKRIFKYCFWMANAISVRDTASFKLLQDWGCRQNYVLAPDMVFSYPHSASRTAAPGRNRLGISVINLHRTAAQTDAYIDKLTQLAVAYLQGDACREVWLFGFDGGMENDGVAIERIVINLAMYGDRVTRHEYSRSYVINDFIDVFASCSYMVCSRFHSVVLALKYGIPFFPIAYSDKTLNLLQDIGYDGKVARYASMHELDIDYVMRDITDCGRRFALEANLTAASRDHFAALDRYIAAG